MSLGQGGQRLDLDQRLTVRATPALVTFAGLLALPSMELEARIAWEIEENPALVESERPNCSSCGLVLAGRWCRSCGRCDGIADQAGAALRIRAETPSDVPPGDQLLAEIGPMLPAEDRALAAYVLADLDGRGLLGRDPADLAATLGVPEERLRRVIDAIRSVGPPGICAASVTEMLLLQVDSWGGEPTLPPHVRSLVADHLDDLAAGRLHEIARALGSSVGAIREAAAFVRCHLRPSAAPSGSTAPRLRPAPVDAVVRLDPDNPDDVEVAVVDRHHLRLDPLHERLAAGGGGRLTAQERAAVVERVDSARALLVALDRRSRTLAAVVRHAARHQIDYLRVGPAAHRPLTRATVARDLGLHESTVSRAVAGKWARLPGGRVIPLSDLFGARTAVLVDLRALVAAGAKSDGELAQLLARRGHSVARRTVAKYRGLLGISAARN